MTLALFSLNAVWLSNHNYQLTGFLISVLGINLGKRLSSKAQVLIGTKKFACFFNCHEGLRFGEPGVIRPMTLFCSFIINRAVAKSESFETMTAQS